MKKLFSVITVFLFTLGLAACTDSTRINELESDLETQLEINLDLVDANADLADHNAVLEQDINELENEVDALEGQQFPVQIQVSMVGLDGIANTKYYGFNDESLPSMADLLVFAFDANIMSGDYGNFILGMGDLDVPYGSFISVSENNVASMVGIDDLVIDNNDHFQFEVTWWDTTQQAVYEAIQLFIENQVDNYITTDFIDYNVLLACQDLCDIPLTEAEIEAYLDDTGLSTVQDYFKAIMIANTLTNATRSDSYVTALNAMVTTGAYGQTGLGLLALDSYDHGNDYSAFTTTALDYYTNISTPFDEGLDAGAYGVMALSKYSDEPGIQDLIDDYVDWIIADQLPSGGIKTRDIVWNDTTYPGTENAASLAQVILALVSVGLDPADGDFIEGDTNLVLRLTEFQLSDGTFDWDLNDDINGDPSFSTPQAFIALVTYYHYMNTFGADNNPYMR